MCGLDLVGALVPNLFGSEPGRLVFRAWELFHPDVWAIAPMLGEIAEEYKDKVTIVKLNVDENPKTSQRFNVRSIPTLILFKNGQVEGQKVGAPRKSDLVAFLDSKL